MDIYESFCKHIHFQSKSMNILDILNQLNDASDVINSHEKQEEAFFFNKNSD